MQPPLGPRRIGRHIPPAGHVRARDISRSESGLYRTSGHLPTFCFHRSVSWRQFSTTTWPRPGNARCSRPMRTSRRSRRATNPPSTLALHRHPWHPNPCSPPVLARSDRGFLCRRSRHSRYLSSGWSTARSTTGRVEHRVWRCSPRTPVLNTFSAFPAIPVLPWRSSREDSSSPFPPQEGLALGTRRSQGEKTWSTLPSSPVFSTISARDAFPFSTRTSCSYDYNSVPYSASRKQQCPLLGLLDISVPCSLRNVGHSATTSPRYVLDDAGRSA